jgi:hypothetical protein
MSYNVRNKMETVQGLAGVGIEIGAIVARESIKNTFLISRYMARQGMGALRTSLEVATQATDMYGLSKRRDEYTEGSIKQAMGEAVEAVGHDPNSAAAETKLGVFATKLSCAHDLISEVRIVVDDPSEPDIIIPTDTIKQRYLEEFGIAVEIMGIHPDDAQYYMEGLRERAGIEVYPAEEPIVETTQLLSM